MLPSEGSLAFVLARPWLCWGLLPVASACSAYVLTSLLLEWYIRRPGMDTKLILYDSVKKKVDEKEKESAESRIALAEECQKQTDKFSGKPMSLFLQWRYGVWVTAGPSATLLAVLLLAPGMDYVAGDFSQKLQPLTMARHFLSLAFVCDFFLYWGHRIQHEVPYLWKNVHAQHHQLGTPTPAGTIFIHDLDATLQASLPLLLGGLLVRPHPVLYWLYIFCHIANNVQNHSGVDCEKDALFRVVTGRCLPLRSSARHHDAHHRFSNYGGKAKNFAEMFWIWDWAFGTLRRL